MLLLHLRVDLREKSVAVELSSLFLLFGAEDDDGIELLVVAPPLLVESGLDVEVDLVAVGHFHRLSDVVAEGVANDGDQEVGEDQEEEELVQEPNEPDEGDHRVGIGSSHCFLILLILVFNLQVCAPLGVIRSIDIADGVSPGCNQNDQKLMKFRIVSSAV